MATANRMPSGGPRCVSSGLIYDLYHMGATRILLRGAVTDSNRSSLVLALRLMTATESMRSAVRGLKRLPSEQSPATQADRYYLLFAAVGAVGEAIKVIKDAISKKRIVHSMIEREPGLTAIWDKVTADPVPRDVKVAMRARDKYWAHWDEDIAKHFISSLANTDSIPAIVESCGEGENATTAFLWVRLAWFADLERGLKLATGDEAASLVQDMMDLIKDAIDLAGTLAVRVLSRAGFTTALETPSAVSPKPSAWSGEE